MPLYTFRALANGLHTDHPVPDLPFVDDSHIPVEDPEAIEATGRHHGTDMWGRFDHVRRFGGWVAFTTHPVRHDLGWVVRWHPGHGRSVLLYRDDDVASVYEDFQGPALLFRAGGYWWDGTTWYRPDQVWDTAAEDWYHRLVPSAATVTAADMLAAAAADADRGKVVAIGAAGPGMAPSGRWRDDLARWARERPAGSLRDSVVNLTAPELAADQMVGAAELAETGGIGASTLRAYIARGEADVPAAGLPQRPQPVGAAGRRGLGRSPAAVPRGNRAGRVRRAGQRTASAWARRPAEPVLRLDLHALVGTPRRPQALGPAVAHRDSRPRSRR